ncbi:hypothetical protein QBC45DRAFT_392209 [Copromyces sp. CBS 386.78]|nr:hypothetical protein QBC45DRAFT_392209 [Copromyces sp. CBS 386.78]
MGSFGTAHNDWPKSTAPRVPLAPPEALVQYYNQLATELKIDLSAPAKVIYGRDTRSSGHTLVTALAAALDATETEHVDYKILTTRALSQTSRSTRLP